MLSTYSLLVTGTPMPKERTGDTLQLKSKLKLNKDDNTNEYGSASCAANLSHFKK